MDDKEKKYVAVIAILAVILLAMLMARWWNCDCNSRSNYEDVRNLPVYAGNKVINGSIGNANRQPQSFV